MQVDNCVVHFSYDGDIQEVSKWIPHAKQIFRQIKKQKLTHHVQYPTNDVKIIVQLLPPNLGRIRIEVKSGNSFYALGINSSYLYIKEIDINGSKIVNKRWDNIIPFAQSAQIGSVNKAGIGYSISALTSGFYYNNGTQFSNQEITPRGIGLLKSKTNHEILVDTYSHWPDVTDSFLNNPNHPGLQITNQASLSGVYVHPFRKYYLYISQRNDLSHIIVPGRPEITILYSSLHKKYFTSGIDEEMSLVNPITSSSIAIYQATSERQYLTYRKYKTNEEYYIVSVSPRIYLKYFDNILVKNTGFALERISATEKRIYMAVCDANINLIEIWAFNKDTVSFDAPIIKYTIEYPIGMAPGTPFVSTFEVLDNRLLLLRAHTSLGGSSLTDWNYELFEISQTETEDRILPLTPTTEYPWFYKKIPLESYIGGITLTVGETGAIKNIGENYVI